MYPINQAILILDSNVSGKVLGPVQGDSYIVQLDQPTPVTKAIIVHEDNMRILDCHWCRDSQRVPETPFYIGQYETDTIPTKPCPYCTEKVAVTCG